MLNIPPFRSPRAFRLPMDRLCETFHQFDLRWTENARHSTTSTSSGQTMQDIRQNQGRDACAQGHRKSTCNNPIEVAVHSITTMCLGVTVADCSLDCHPIALPRGRAGRITHVGRQVLGNISIDLSHLSCYRRFRR